MCWSPHCAHVDKCIAKGHQKLWKLLTGMFLPLPSWEQAASPAYTGGLWQSCGSTIVSLISVWRIILQIDNLPSCDSYPCGVLVWALTSSTTAMQQVLLALVCQSEIKEGFVLTLVCKFFSAFHGFDWQLIFFIEAHMMRILRCRKTVFVGFRRCFGSLFPLSFSISSFLSTFPLFWHLISNSSSPMSGVVLWFNPAGISAPHSHTTAAPQLDGDENQKGKSGRTCGLR